MTDVITFTPDDARLGTLADDGSIASWPTQDIDGRALDEYSRRDWTHQRLSGNRFVLIAPWRAAVVTPLLASEMATPTNKSDDAPTVVRAAQRVRPAPSEPGKDS